MLKANDGLVPSFRHTLFSPYFVGRFTGRGVRRILCCRPPQTFHAEVFPPALRDGALDFEAQPDILRGTGHLLFEFAIVQSPVQTTVVMRRIWTVLFPFGETDLKVRDLPGRGSLRHKNS